MRIIAYAILGWALWTRLSSHGLQVCRKQARSSMFTLGADRPESL